MKTIAYLPKSRIQCTTAIIATINVVPVLVPIIPVLLVALILVLPKLFDANCDCEVVWVMQPASCAMEE
jgi:hypothetical protein